MAVKNHVLRSLQVLKVRLRKQTCDWAVLCGKMTSNGHVSEKVSFQPGELQPWEPLTGRDTVNPPHLKP